MDPLHLPPPPSRERPESANGHGRPILPVFDADAKPGDEGPESSDGQGPSAASFEVVYRKAVQPVLRLLPRLGIPDSDWEDVAQDVFISIYQELDTLDPTLDVVVWALTIAHRVATKHRRRHRDRRERLEGELPEHQRERLAEYHRRADGHDPELRAASLENCRLLDRLLATLDDDARLVLILHDLEDRRQREIARVLGVPESTVHDRLLRGRKALAAKVERLAPADREALRAFGVVPLFVIEPNHLANGLANVHEEIWGRLQERLRKDAAGPAGWAWARFPASATSQLVGGGLIVFFTGGLTGAGLHAALQPSAPEGGEPTIVAERDAVIASIATRPADSATAAAATSPSEVVSTIALQSTAAPTATSLPGAGARRAGGVQVLPGGELIDRADAELKAGHLDVAIPNLLRHAQLYPRGHRWQDRESMLIQALRLAGRDADAATRQKQLREDAAYGLLRPAIDGAAGTTSKPRTRP